MTHMYLIKSVMAELLEFWYCSCWQKRLWKRSTEVVHTAHLIFFEVRKWKQTAYTVDTNLLTKMNFHFSPTLMDGGQWIVCKLAMTFTVLRMMIRQFSGCAAKWIKEWKDFYFTHERKEILYSSNLCASRQHSGAALKWSPGSVLVQWCHLLLPRTPSSARSGGSQCGAPLCQC